MKGCRNMAAGNHVGVCIDCWNNFPPHIRTLINLREKAAMLAERAYRNNR